MLYYVTTVLHDTVTDTELSHRVREFPTADAARAFYRARLFIFRLSTWGTVDDAPDRAQFTTDRGFTITVTTGPVAR